MSLLLPPLLLESSLLINIVPLFIWIPTSEAEPLNVGNEANLGDLRKTRT